VLSILQISDPHFGPFSHWPRLEPQQAADKLAAEIRAALKKRGGKELPYSYDFVLLTGDFTWGPPVEGHPQSYEKGFETAKLFIRKLIDGHLARSFDSVVLIPGNHDIRWAQRGQNGDFQFQSRSRAEYYYRKLVQEALPEQGGDQPGKHLQLQSHLGHVHVFPDKFCDFVLLALNSTRIESAEHSGIGYVGADQIYGLLGQLDYSRADRHCRVVAALHHHLQPVESVRLRQMLLPKAERRYSFVTDGFDVLTTLLEIQADAVLHGHMHVPHHCFHGLVPLEDSATRSISIAALSSAGSIGLGAASRNIGEGHQFQVIELWENAIRFYSFEAPLVNPGEERDWRMRTLHLPFELSARPLSRLQTAHNSRRLKRSLHELAAFESELLMEAWVRGDEKARERVRENVRQRKLHPRVVAEFDAAFRYAESQLATKQFGAEYRRALEEDNPKSLARCVEEKMNEWGVER
jgi:hypothetical protein